MFLMEGKREAEIVESGGVWVLAETHIFNFLFGNSDGRCYECCVFAREWAYDLACVVISSGFFG